MAPKGRAAEIALCRRIHARCPEKSGGQPTQPRFWLEGGSFTRRPFRSQLPAPSSRLPAAGCRLYREKSTDLSSPRGKIQSNYPTFHATYALIPSKSFGRLTLSI